MPSYQTRMMVLCRMLTSYYYTGRYNHRITHGTAQPIMSLGDTGFLLTIDPDSDDANGSEGTLHFFAWDAVKSFAFSIHYVCNSALENEVTVTAGDGFDVVITPAPDVLKDQAPMNEIRIVITQK